MVQLAPILQEIPQVVRVGSHDGSGSHARKLHETFPFHAGGRRESEGITWTPAELNIYRSYSD